jgi:hypothetical protein
MSVGFPLPLSRDQDLDRQCAGPFDLGRIEQDGSSAAIAQVLENGARSGDVHRCGQLKHVVQFEYSKRPYLAADRGSARDPAGSHESGTAFQG